MTKPRHPDSRCFFDYRTRKGETFSLLVMRNGPAPEDVEVDGQRAVCDRSSRREARDHQPQLGERVIINVTGESALRLANEMVDAQLRAEKRRSHEGKLGVRQAFSSRELAVKGALEYIRVKAPCEVVTVTSDLQQKLGKDAFLAEADEPTRMEDVAEALSKIGAFAKLTLPPGASFFDRQGKPIGVEEFAQLRFGSRAAGYARVAQNEVTPSVDVSTVWLGMVLRPQGRPKIFETMVFVNGKGEESRQYCTEQEALTGHAEMVAFARAKYDTPMN